MKRTLHSLIILCLITLTSVCPAHGQTVEDSIATAGWKVLAKLEYIKKYDDFLGFQVDVPIFSDEVKALEGKELTVRGYIIPIEGYKSHREFIFSAYPYNMCYFCGGAGPETVLDVVASKPIKYSAEPMTIRGRLLLNTTGDINQLMYKLEDVIRVD